MIAPHLIPLPAGITCIDTGLFRPRMAAAYLLQHKDKAAIVETGVTNTVPRVLNALRNRDVSFEDVLYVIPTHVHLDHAGGTGKLMQEFPNARLVIHPRGARHLIDPSKLWAGSMEVYGEDTLERIYGRPVPVAKERVIEAPDGFELDVAGRMLKFIDTAGHARHHFSVYDEQSRGFFTGDTFGVSYRETDSERGAFMIPTTTPVQFDPQAWHASLDRYLSFRPQRMFLTHFAMVENIEMLTGSLRRALDDYVAIALSFRDQAARREKLKAALLTYSLNGLREHRCPLPEPALRGLLEMDMDLNAQGLEVWLASRPA
jgi:glyoxylase-like metal-dependent hydrolase (beta-lactamase superfamily II)